MESRPAKEPEIELFVKVGLARPVGAVGGGQEVPLALVALWESRRGGVGSSRPRGMLWSSGGPAALRAIKTARERGERARGTQ